MAFQKIPKDAIVLLYTGLGSSFGTPAYENTPTPGFDTNAVNQLFNQRKIKGLGSDTFGPDASDDSNFEASSAAYVSFSFTLFFIIFDGLLIVFV